MPFTSPPHNSSGSYINSQQGIDDEITQLEARIRSLKSARNALAPISHLHPEILQEIFFLVHDGSCPKGNGTLLVTWVSREWRELACNTTNLWTYIDFKHPEWIQIALARTKNCDLELSVEFLSPAHLSRLIVSSAFPLCLSNLSRMKAFALRCQTFRCSPIPDSRPEWTTPVPVLTKLELTQVTLPPHLFSGTCPSLQSLNLTACTVDWNTLPVFPSLKELSIIYPEQPTTLETVISILRGVGQNLEELKLFHGFVTTPEPDHQALASLGRVQLHNLRVFSMRNSNWNLNASRTFLSHISLPQYVNTFLHVRFWEETVIADALLSSRNISRWEIDRLVITTNNGADSRTIEITESDLDGNVIKMDGVDSNLMAVKPVSSQGFTTRFFVEEGRNVSVIRYFEGLGTIRNLSFDQWAFSEFIESLREQDILLCMALGHEGDLGGAMNQRKVTVGKSLISFHNLQVLEIFREGIRMDEYSLSRGDALILQKWLAWRNRLGLRLDKLVISGIIAPPSTWLHGLFDKLVAYFEVVDIEEDKSE
ncbi:hypothetical protein BDN72DRAFT_959325 [Pluteus cervinus]|uniref:Uncharacterized protein n=1 Tax=Pluteus cervinus TaxID=181527 RepID=A0ACD3AVE9_9AGAR|nr:hypothetical protein BDN72DRAFT_959325 [Pluteus cervinus]